MTEPQPLTADALAALWARLDSQPDQDIGVFLHAEHYRRLRATLDAAAQERAALAEEVARLQAAEQALRDVQDQRNTLWDRLNAGWHAYHEVPDQAAYWQRTGLLLKVISRDE